MQITMTDHPTNLLRFIDAAVSPYHASQEGKRMLERAGFTELKEADPWRLEPDGAYFLLRGGKTLMAWRQGSSRVSEHGFRIVAAHSDSPALKLRPNGELSLHSGGFLTTEIYGSPLLHTWLDRDLKVVGAIYFEDEDGQMQRRLVNLADLRVRAISLAPHLRTDKKFDEVTINKHRDLPVIVSSDGARLREALELRLMEAAPKARRILTFDCSLADATPGAVIGVENEFISASRLDNLYSSYAALEGIIQTSEPVAHTSIAAIFDAEEIGSAVWTGARSNALDSLLARIAASYGDGEEGLIRAKARSVVLSADMAHAEHPSFPEATDSGHVPHLNQGIAVKFGARGNYAVGPRATAWFKLICDQSGVATQNFMYRCDHGAGSSVGPLITTSVGIEGVDVGAPMLAMHSIRELAGVRDLEPLIRSFREAYASPVPLPEG